MFEPNRDVAGLALALCLEMTVAAGALAGVGDWPERRQNPCLTAMQSLPGRLAGPPCARATFDLGSARPGITVVPLPGGRGHVGLCQVGGALQCYDTRGRLLWQSHPPGLNFGTICTTEDLDGDGHPEVLLMAGRAQEPYGAAVLVSLETGQLLWRYDVEPMSYAWYLHVGHFLPDRRSKQIIVIMQGYPPDEKNGYMVLFEYPGEGTLPQHKWRYDFHEYTCFPTFLQSDLDGDGVQELVVETHSRMWFLDARTGVLKHFVAWDVAPANVRSYGHTRFLDLNGDGRDDFLCIADFAQHHEVLLNRGGKMEKAWHHGWPANVTTGTIVTTWPEPPQADIDGDGGLEVVVSMFNAEGRRAWWVRVYDAVTGQLKSRWPGMVAVRLADTNGDGAAEIWGNRSDDATQTDLLGAQLVAMVDGRLQAIWQDRDAKALPMLLPRDPSRPRIVPATGVPAAEPLRVQRDADIFCLARDAQGQFQLQAWQPPAPESAPDFSAVPALRAVAEPTLLAADLDGDGGNELVVHTASHVQVLRFTGTGLVPMAKYRSDGAPAFADLDGDAKIEIVLMTVGPVQTPVVEAVTPALGDRQLWRCEFPKADRFGLPAPRQAYVRTIHLTGKPTPDLYVWAGIPLVRSAGLDGLTGAILWEKGEVPLSADFKEHRYYGPSMNEASAWDFNADGKQDLIFTNPDYYCVADGLTGGLLLGPLFPKAIFQQPSQGLYTCPVLLPGPRSGPTVCLVAGHYFQAAMSLRADPYWYRLPAAGESRCAGEGFLRLDDGTWLMGFGRQNGTFACIDVRDAAVRWEMPVAAATSDVVTCDIDGDGRGEFLFGTSHGDLYAVGDGGERPRLVWKTALGQAAGGLMVADLDGDGYSEIVVATADGRLHVFGESVSSNHGRAVP